MTTGSEIGLFAKIFSPFIKLFTKRIFHEDALWNRKANPFCATPLCKNKLEISKCEMGYVKGVLLKCKKCGWKKKIARKTVDQIKREAYGKFKGS